MLAVFLGSRLNNQIGLASKQYATDNFFFIVMTPVSVFLTSLPETDKLRSSLGGTLGTSKNQERFLSTTVNLFLSSLISFLSLSTVLPIVPQSLVTDATDLVIVVMVD